MAILNEKRIELEYKVRHLKNPQQSIAGEKLPFDQNLKISITNESTEEQKVMLFRSLFRGREDIFPKRFESKRTGKSGYQPVCRNE